MHTTDDDFDYRVDQAVTDLYRVHRGEDAHYHLSCTIDWLRRAVAGKRTVSEVQRDRLFQAIDSARQTAARLFSSVDEIAHTISGFDAVLELVFRWHDPGNDEGASLEPRHRLDIRARILQNLCHNESMKEDLGSSALEARPEAVTAAARHFVATARASLIAALNPEHTLEHSIGAINTLCRAGVTILDLPNLVADGAPIVLAAAQRVAPVLAESVDRSISAHDVYMGLSSAAGLLFASTFRAEQHAHASILLHQLTAFQYRQLLERQGDPLTRSIRARQAWDHAAPASRLQ